MTEPESSPPLRGRGQGEGGVSPALTGPRFSTADIRLPHPHPPAPSPQGGGGGIEKSDRAGASAKRLRRTPTLAERLLWAELRKHRGTGFHFRRQAPIGRYIPDFVCHSAKLIVEFDGGVHQFTADRDAARDQWLTARGFHVLRFDNGAVIQDLTGVLQSIDYHLKKKT